jgi:hypothetical protein
MSVLFLLVVAAAAGYVVYVLVEADSDTPPSDGPNTGDGA